MADMFVVMAGKGVALAVLSASGFVTVDERTQRVRFQIPPWLRRAVSAGLLSLREKARKRDRRPRAEQAPDLPAIRDASGDGCIARLRAPDAREVVGKVGGTAVSDGPR